MSPSRQQHRSPGKGQESGRTTRDEHERIESIGSDAKTGRETDDTTRSGQYPGDDWSAGQTVAAGLSPGRSQGVGLEAAWETQQQPPGGGDETEGVGPTKEPIRGLWPHPGP